MDDPILVDEKGVITQGHHRIIAARKAGISIPPQAIQRGLSYHGPRLDWADVYVLN
jgi:hypothetical protein